MKRSNLRCEDCEHEWFEHSLTHRSSGIYINRRKAKCPECDSEEISYIKDEDKDFKSVAFGKFASASPEEKSKMLKQRSREHYRKKIHEKAVEMDRNPHKYT